MAPKDTPTSRQPPRLIAKPRQKNRTNTTKLARQEMNLAPRSQIARRRNQAARTRTRFDNPLERMGMGPLTGSTKKITPLQEYRPGPAPTPAPDWVTQGLKLGSNPDLYKQYQKNIHNLRTGAVASKRIADQAAQAFPSIPSNEVEGMLQSEADRFVSSGDWKSLAYGGDPVGENDLYETVDETTGETVQKAGLDALNEEYKQFVKNGALDETAAMGYAASQFLDEYAASALMPQLQERHQMFSDDVFAAAAKQLMADRVQPHIDRALTDATLRANQMMARAAQTWDPIERMSMEDNAAAIMQHGQDTANWLYDQATAAPQRAAEIRGLEEFVNTEESLTQKILTNLLTGGTGGGSSGGGSDVDAMFEEEMGFGDATGGAQSGWLGSAAQIMDPSTAYLDQYQSQATNGSLFQQMETYPFMGMNVTPSQAQILLDSGLAESGTGSYPGFLPAPVPSKAGKMPSAWYNG